MTIETSGSAALGVLVVVFGIGLAMIILCIAGWWKMFKKAGQPGWASLVPLYNLLVLLKIAGRPEWWIALFFVPFVNIAILLIMVIDLAKSFGRSAAFGVVLLFLFPIGYVILGLGRSRYVGPAGAAPTLATA